MTCLSRGAGEDNPASRGSARSWTCVPSCPAVEGARELPFAEPPMLDTAQRPPGARCLFASGVTGRMVCFLNTVCKRDVCLLEIIPFPLACSPPPKRRPGKHQRCSHMKHFFRPDTERSDVEIEISHSEGPKWLQRSAGGFRVRPLVSHGERCRPKLASADTRASEVLCAKGVCLTSVPPHPSTHSTSLSRGARPTHLVNTSAECNLLSQTDVCVCCRRGRGALNTG